MGGIIEQIIQRSLNCIVYKYIIVLGLELFLIKKIVKHLLIKFRTALKKRKEGTIVPF